jgi:hypothetical protein
MASEKTKVWPEDSTQIDMADKDGLEFWSRLLRVSPAMLRRAVGEVGPRYKDVERYLDCQRHGVASDAELSYPHP